METPRSNKESVNNLLDICGFGPWQWNVYILLFILHLFGAWQSFLITFLAPNIDFDCVPTNISLIDELSSNRNVSAKIVDQCHFAVVPDEAVQMENVSTSTMVFPCTQWTYNLSSNSETIVSEWDLVCSRAWLVSLSKSIYMIGFLFSVIVFGQISDCVGRFPTIMICYAILCTSGLLTVFTSSYLMFVILRFFQAFGRTGLSTTAYVLIMELTPQKLRPAAGLFYSLGFTIGCIVFPGVAWFIRDWFWLQMASVIPFLPCFIVYWIIPESPRWLLTKGKFPEFKKCMSIGMKRNGRPGEVNSEHFQTLFELSKNDAKEEKMRTVLDLFRKPRMRCRMLIGMYLWMTTAFVYYGLTFNTNDLSGNPYLNFCMISIVEIPAYLWTYQGSIKLGRRTTMVASIIVAGISCATIAVCPNDMPTLKTVLAMFGKLCIASCFKVLHFFCSEIFPTVVRNVAIGSLSTSARVGSTLAPFVRELGKATHPSVPNVLYGVFAVTSGLLGLLLPETKDQKLADTLEEGEQFGLSLQQSSKPTFEIIKGEQLH